MRIVALLTVRNEELYLARCLQHLYEQGIETCVIDNESTDRSLEIAKEFLGRGVFRIETLPYHGEFSLSDQCAHQEQLALDIDADWFIHHDADEIMQAPKQFDTLAEGIRYVDSRGFNIINFDEFVFIPTNEHAGYEGADYVALMTNYYFFEPAPMRLFRIWKKSQNVCLSDSGGHNVSFSGKKLYPHNFILRHYIGLSAEYLKKKYSNRKYSKNEVKERGWHRARVTWSGQKLVLPDSSRLKCIQSSSGLFNKSQPERTHLFKFIDKRGCDG